MSFYRTNQGDMVDAIAKSQYGREDATVAIYEANPGLAAHGPILPMGLEIELPEIETPSEAGSIRLWG